jgi:hypothetical protein
MPIHFFQTPHPTPSCSKKNQTSASHATQETTLWVSPHPKNNSPIPTPLKNPPLEKGGITLILPSSPKKTLWKKKKKS